MSAAGLRPEQRQRLTGHFSKVLELGAGRLEDDLNILDALPEGQQAARRGATTSLLGFFLDASIDELAVCVSRRLTRDVERVAETSRRRQDVVVVRDHVGSVWVCNTVIRSSQFGMLVVY